MSYFPYRVISNPIIAVLLKKSKVVLTDSTKVPGKKASMRLRANDIVAVELISGNLGKGTITVAAMDGSRFQLKNDEFATKSELVLKGARENENALKKALAAF